MPKATTQGLTRLILIRHTRVAVPPGICYGQSDVALADSFSSEVEHVLQSLSATVQTTPDMVTEEVSIVRISDMQTSKTIVDMHISSLCCYHSPLSRCQRLAHALHPASRRDPRLMELNFGRWEGTTWDDIYRDPESRGWFDDYIHTATPQGESYMDMEQRVAHFMQSIHAGDTVIAITHAGPIRAALSLAGYCSVDEAYARPIGYGEVIQILYRPDALHSADSAGG